MRTFLILLLILPALGSFSQNKVIRIRPVAGVSDYSSTFQDALNQVFWAGGGQVIVESGSYPFKRAVVIESHEVRNRNIAISIVGNSSASSQLPKLQIANATQPQIFFQISGNGNAPSIAIKFQNLQFDGNNKPFGANQMYKRAMTPQPAIRLLNIATATIENLTINNVYGDGIALANYGKSLNTRIQRPVIRNVRINNCWSWNGKDNGGDGIMLWFVNGPLVERCSIVNDIRKTKSYSRAGIVVENQSVGAVIRNNTIAGYQRNIHIEGTYGGHTITGNTFSQSSIAVTFNELAFEGTSSSSFKPTVIESNSMNYDIGEQSASINRPFRDWSFISGNMNGKNLYEVSVRNNTFNYIGRGRAGIKNKLSEPDNIFIYFRNKNGYNKPVKNVGNKFLVK